MQIKALFKEYRCAYDHIEFEASKFGNFECVYLLKYLKYIMMFHTKRACN